MKKKNGFTLVELLATIVILGVVLSISGYVIFRAIKNTKDNSYKVTLNEIESNSSNYLTENKDKLFFITDSQEEHEYQCITVQNLVDSGYLKDTITESKIDENTFVGKNNYIYVERNINTKTIDKVKYLTDSNTDDINTCNQAVLAKGDISIVSNPDNNTWSKTKTITITYSLKNITDINTINDYIYNYSYTADSTLESDNGNVKVVKVDQTGTIIANIKYGGTEIASGSLKVEKIDDIKPTVTDNYTGSEVVSGSVIIPLIFTDNETGADYDSFTKDDLVITIGGNNANDFELEHATGDNYNLRINNNNMDGAIVIMIPSDKVKDNADNWNNQFEITPSISFANTYTITFNANGGSAPNPASKTVTYGGTYGTLATTSRSSYTFNGWYTAASGGTRINASSTFNQTSNQTLYAHWTYNTPTPSTPSTPTITTDLCAFQTGISQRLCQINNLMNELCSQHPTTCNCPGQPACDTGGGGGGGGEGCNCGWCCCNPSRCSDNPLVTGQE